MQTCTSNITGACQGWPKKWVQAWNVSGVTTAINTAHLADLICPPNPIASLLHSSPAVFHPPFPSSALSSPPPPSYICQQGYLPEHVRQLWPSCWGSNSVQLCRQPESSFVTAVKLWGSLHWWHAWSDNGTAHLGYIIKDVSAFCTGYLIKVSLNHVPLPFLHRQTGGIMIKEGFLRKLC